MTGGSRCGTGTVALGASGAGTGQDYKWYDAATGGNLLQTGGTTFTTPSIDVTTPYYVSIYDTTTNCESTRATVTATINPNPTVTITEGNCNLGKVILTANPAGGTGPYSYVWTPGGAITASITVAGDGVTSYTVTVTDILTCSGTSAAHMVALCGTCITLAPRTTAGGATTFCAGGSVELTAAPVERRRPLHLPVDPRRRHDGTITVTTSGSYSCQVTDTTPACGNTVTTNAVVVTVNPNPTVTISEGACSVGNVVLTANPAGGTGPYTYAVGPRRRHDQHASRCLAME